MLGVGGAAAVAAEEQGVAPLQGLDEKLGSLLDRGAQGVGGGGERVDGFEEAIAYEGLGHALLLR
ncbi:hypothetical protein D3C86_1960710 [compost metagenome]